MAKKVKSGTILAIVGFIVLLGLVAFLLVPQVITNGGGVNIESCPDATGILTVNAINALEKGTAVSGPTITAGVNGQTLSTTVTSGTTTFPVGSEVTVLVSKADYLDEKFTFTMPCGGKTLEAPLYYATSDNPSVRIKNDDGDYLTDAIAGGAVNQTDLSAGETVNFDVEFQGTALENSGDLVYIVEFPANSGVNISQVNMAGANKLNSVPSIHSSLNAGSKIVAFEIPALVGSEKKVYTLSVSLEASKDLAGGVYTDWYAKQYFIDDDGSIQYGIQDASGDAKSENTGDFDFLIESE